MTGFGLGMQGFPADAHIVHAVTFYRFVLLLSRLIFFSSAKEGGYVCIIGCQRCLLKCRLNIFLFSRSYTVFVSCLTVKEMVAFVERVFQGFIIVPPVYLWTFSWTEI